MLVLAAGTPSPGSGRFLQQLTDWSGPGRPPLAALVVLESPPGFSSAGSDPFSDAAPPLDAWLGPFSIDEATPEQGDLLSAFAEAFLADHDDPPSAPPSWRAVAAQLSIPCLVIDPHAPGAITPPGHTPPELGVALWDGAKLLHRLTPWPRRGVLALGVGTTRAGLDDPVPGLRELADAGPAGSHCKLAVFHLRDPFGPGTILAQQRIEIDSRETLESLTLKLDGLGPRFLLSVLTAWLRQPWPGLPAEPGAPFDAGRAPALAAKRRGLVRGMQRYAWEPAGNHLARMAGQAGLYLERREARRHIRGTFLKARNAPVMVFYHHRSANDDDHPITLPFDEFARQMGFARRFVDLIGPEEAVERLASGGNPRPAVVITFDDGHAKDLTTTVPLLADHGDPAGFFICPGQFRERDRPADYPVMREAALRGLRDQGFLVGSHSMDHADLGHSSGDHLRWELIRSREILEEMLGQPVTHFAYPFGRNGENITTESHRLAAATYRYLYSAYGGYNFPHRFDGVHLRRFPTPSSVLELAGVVAGLVPWWMEAGAEGRPWGTPLNGTPPF